MESPNYINANTIEKKNNFSEIKMWIYDVAYFILENKRKMSFSHFIEFVLYDLLYFIIKNSCFVNLIYNTLEKLSTEKSAFVYCIKSFFKNCYKQKFSIFYSL